MGYTKIDINVRLFLYWTHADAGRRLAPSPLLGARIKTSETGAGDTNYMNGRGVSGVTGITWGYRPAHADRAQVYEAARAAVNAFSQYLDLPCLMGRVPKTGARLSARDPGLHGAELGPGSVPSSRPVVCGPDTDKSRSKPRCFNNMPAWTAARTALIHTQKETYR
jgi:hypothetical protein